MKSTGKIVQKCTLRYISLRLEVQPNYETKEIRNFYYKHYKHVFLGAV